MYPCSSCGLCCRNISKIKQLENYNLGNGICKYLDTKTDLCTIYEKRPDICCIDETFELLYKQVISKRDFYIKNSEVCNKLQVKYRLNKKFKVIIGE